MSVSLLRQLLMKDLMKESAKRTGIMTINKNLSKDVEKLLQKYISSAQSQGVDLDTLGEQQLKYIIQLNKQPTDGIPQAISADSDEGRKITEALFGKQKAPVVDMTGKTIDTSQGILGGKSVKELMDSGQITKGTVSKKNDKVLNRDLFKNSNLNETDAQIKARLDAGNKKSVKNIKDREMTADEIEDFEMEMGDLEPYDFDGTIGSANKIRKDAKAYEKEMYQQYKMGKLDPEAGDKSPARKKFLEKKLEEMEASGDSKLMTRDEIEELTFFDIIPEDMATGGRAGYAVGNQVMPAIDPGMNVEYDTLVDQNTAQRGFMDNWRNHAITSQKMKGKAGLESIPNYGMQSGYDFKKNFQDMNPKVAAGLSLGYQGLTEGLGMFNPNNPNFLNPIKTGKTIYNDYQKNVEGILNAEANNLTPKEQADRNKYLEVKDPVVEPSAMPQGSPGQLNPTPTQEKFNGIGAGKLNPDGSLVQVGTNESGFPQWMELDEAKAIGVTPANQKPTMADVAGPAATGGGYAGDSNNVVSEDPLGLIQQVNKLRNGQTPSSNYSYQPEEGGYVQWDGTSYSVVDPEQIKRDVGLASGGRAGYYGGGQAVVGEDLSEIGHGSDSLMARNMQIAPGGQATTSTGLNYLLGQDNDTVRVPYNEGGPARQNFAMGKRAFLKLLGSGAAGIAGLKTGLFGVGKKEAAKEVVKEVATSSGGVPPYFLKLVSKIKSLGDDVTETSAVADRQKVTRYKDFELTEDVSTGRVEIQRVKVAEDMDYYGSPVTEETFMGYSPAEEIFQQTAKGKTKIIKTQPKYEEGTTYLRNDGPNTGNVLDETSGLSDDIFKEVGEEVPEIIRKTKADGGRIGLFMGGGLTAGKGLAREMLKFMSKGSVNAKTPKELLQLYNPKQFNKLLDNPAYTGKISPKTGETADEMILDIIDQTKNDRSSMIGDLIGSARKIKKVDDDIKKYKQTIIKQMLDGGIDEDTAYSFADKMAKEMKENAAPQLTSSPPKVTEQGLIELENIQKNLLTKGRQLQATGGLATMLGE